jgi:hypothetical protein
MQKSLDQKLTAIRAEPGRSCAFVLADAKDADMATGLAATGVDPVTRRRRTLAEYREQIREVIEQGLVDIVLMSTSTSEQLTIRERLFDSTAITPACRANDTTDIHLPAGGTYAQSPSRPFRTALIDHMQAGRLNPTQNERLLGANLGLYSITPNNDVEFDYPTLNAYGDFRQEAEAKGFRHFLEVFDPNACGEHCPADLGRFINDLIARTLAGVATAGRPVFLKIAYHGPAAMEELATYDPLLVPGILGGASGTTFDAFHQLWEAKKHGARAALYGRMINNSEHQTTFIQHLRWIADGVIDDPAEGVRSYHGALAKINIPPHRALADDLQPTRRGSSYSGANGKTSANVPAMPTSAPGAKESEPVRRYRDKWNRILG